MKWPSLEGVIGEKRKLYHIIVCINVSHFKLHVFTTNYTCHLFFSRANPIDNLASICSILNLTGGFIFQHVSLKKLDLLSTKPRATLTILLCSTNFPMNARLT